MCGVSLGRHGCCKCGAYQCRGKECGGRGEEHGGRVVISRITFEPVHANTSPSLPTLSCPDN